MPTYTAKRIGCRLTQLVVGMGKHFIMGERDTTEKIDKLAPIDKQPVIISKGKGEGEGREGAKLEGR